MSDFDLRVLVREVLADGGCDSFREYAIKVLGQVPQRELKNALLATLPDYIRTVDHKSAPVALPGVGQHASRRVAGIAGAWANFIARHITTDVGTQIRLAEASEDQVRFYVGLLRVKAAQTNETANGFEQIANLMAEQKVTRVKDLPAHVARDLIKGVAA